MLAFLHWKILHKFIEFDLITLINFLVIAQVLVNINLKVNLQTEMPGKRN